MEQDHQNVVAAAIVTLAFVIQSVATLRSGRKTRQTVGEQLAELRGICVGADGKNGLRGDIAEVKQEIRDIKKTAHDRNDRMQASLSEVHAGIARLDERTRSS